MAATDVLIAGAGPVGLTAAVELRRRGVACRIVDQLLEPPQYAKAVGVQPRTLEIFEGMGVVRQVLDAAIEFAGQITYVDGQEVGRLEFPPLPGHPVRVHRHPAVRDRADPAGAARRARDRRSSATSGWSASSRTTTA